MASKAELESKQSTISILIVHYKNIQDTLNCLGSIYRNEPALDFEIIVMDNDPQSNDGKEIKDKFPLVRYFQMAYNSGFGRANNFAVQQSLGEYLLFLNNDAEITKHAISDSLKKYKSLTNTGLLTCRIIERDSNNVQYSAFLRFPSLRKYIRANFLAIVLTRKKTNIGLQDKAELDFINSKAGYVTWVTGAFMLCAKNIFNSVKGFDDDYFMYSEDVDLCFRLNKMGYKHYLNTNTEIIHGIGKSFNRNNDRNMQIFASELLFLRKNSGFCYFILASFIIKINYISDSIIAFIKKTKLPLYLVLQNKIINKYFISILFYKFRINNHYKYLKVY